MSQPPDGLSPIKRALIELRDLQQRLQEAERVRTDPIAIVGAAVRLPGGVTSCDQFWDLLAGGLDAITPVPLDRWNPDEFYDPNADAPGAIVTRFGGFLDRIDEFDARFFGITPREAVGMDPQQRLLLEVAWEALEQAGCPPDSLLGTETGVFIGLGSTDFLGAALKRTTDAEIDAYLASGGVASVAAGRLAYVFGFRGPALTVDTACSSSLTALHLAVNSLRVGECNLALTGGANLLLLPELNMACSRAHMLAPDGRCKTFDASADGYVRSEGAAVVVLKRLRDAEAAGDRILAVIRGTAVNQDGRSSGLTVPNGPAQEQVIRAALRNGGLDASAVGYVEAHGTGTSLGDPVELRALGRVYGEGREQQPLPIGSVKTNVGHLEAAAGIAGVIKVVLALQHEIVPRHLHCAHPTEHVDWPTLGLSVATEPLPWPKGDRKRVAGISSFGFSGTNAHVIIEEAPPAAADAMRSRPVQLLTLSAKSVPALRSAAERLSDALGRTKFDLADVCHTLSAGRTHFQERAAIPVRSEDELRDAVRAIADVGMCPRGARGKAAAAPAIAFFFPGTADDSKTTRALLDAEPAFRRAFEECDGLAGAIVAVSPLAQLSVEQVDDRSTVDARSRHVANFCFEYALATMWRTWGIAPAYVLGDGVGAIAAACVAGALDPADALRLVAARASLVDRVDGARDEAAVDEYTALIRNTITRLPDIAFVSAIDGMVLDDPRDPNHWRRQLQEGLRLDDACAALREAGATVFLEIGASGGMGRAGREPTDRRGERWLPSLNSNTDVSGAITQALAELYVAGVAIDWQAFDRSFAARIVSLPSYPFQRERYWPETLESRADAPPRWTPLGRRLRSAALRDVVYESEIGPSRSPLLMQGWTNDGDRSVPAGLFIEMALGADRSRPVVQRIEFDEPLTMPRRGTRLVQLTLSPETGAFTIASANSSADDGRWTTHATGRLAPAGRSRGENVDLDGVRARMPEQVTGSEHYERLATERGRGGAAFEVIRTLSYAEREFLCEIEIPERARTSAWTIHPAILEAVQQAAQYTTPLTRGDMWRGAGEIEYVGALPSRVIAWFRRTSDDNESVARGDLTICRANGDVVLRVADLRHEAAIDRRESAPLVFASPWIHELKWRPVPLAVAPGSEPGESGRWIVLADRGGVGDALASALRRRGAVVDLVADTADQSLDERSTPSRGGPPLRGAINLRFLDAPSLDDVAATNAVEACLPGCLGTLQLLQAFSRSGTKAPIWTVTVNAVPTGMGRATSNVFQGAAWGLGRVLALEHPEVWGGLIDVDEPNADAIAVRIASEVLAPSGEDQIAWRDGERRVPRLVATGAALARPVQLRRDASYVVTGGLGNLGLKIARYLAERGAGHIVLVGRTALPPRDSWADAVNDASIGRRIEGVRAIEAAGADVHLAIADVGDETAMAAVFARFGAALPPLRGIVHAAHDPSTVRLSAMSADDLRRMFRPKIAGMAVLDALAGATIAPLDFFSVFSSSAALVGAVELGHYAAANTCLEAFAQARRLAGRPMTAMSWGAWDDWRVASDAFNRAMDAAGLRLLAVPQALETFGALLHPESAQVVIVDADWPRLKRAYESRGRRAMLDELGDAQGVEHDHAVPATSLRQTLAGLGERARHDEIERRVVDEVVAVLRVSAGSFDPSAGLFDLGMDSLMAIELRSRLEKVFTLTLPATLMFNYPSAIAIAGFIDRQLVPPSSVSDATAGSVLSETAPASVVPAATLDDLTEEELAGLLARTLTEL